VARQGYQNLPRQVASLAKWFAELAKPTAQAARQLETAGAPPSEALMQELGAARKEFADLSASVLQAAHDLSVPAAAIATLGDLERLARAIVQAMELEEKRAALAEARGLALAVLDRILALAHRDDPKSASLAACQAKARATRAAIADATSLDVEGQQTAWAEALQPFGDLLLMVEGQESVDDDRLASLVESISTAFGRPLAMAAVRAKLLAPRNV
jgi:hypothetical protein